MDAAPAQPPHVIAGSRAAVDGSRYWRRGCRAGRAGSTFRLRPLLLRLAAIRCLACEALHCTCGSVHAAYLREAAGAVTAALLALAYALAASSGNWCSAWLSPCCSQARVRRPRTEPVQSADGGYAVLLVSFRSR